MNVYQFFVGSTNPVKVNAVKLALAKELESSKVKGFEVASGVSPQPMGDEETRQGALNRARAALEAGLSQSLKLEESMSFGIGLEGGVVKHPNGELWSTVWATLVTDNGDVYEANGSRIKIPSVIAEPIVTGGEMGPIVQQLTGQSDVRQNQGMFGVITNNYVTRTEEYASVAKMAIGLWYGRGWDQALESKS